MPFLALLGGLPGKLFLYAGIAVAVVAAVTFALRERDNRVRAEMAAASAATISAQRDRDQARIVAALQAEVADASARAAKINSIRKQVDAAPRTTACVTSPAVSAALDGLRGNSNGPGPARPNP